MKTSRLISFAVFLVALSCGREDGAPYADAAKVSVTFSVGGSPEKSEVTDFTDGDVTGMNIFVFNSDGTLDGAASSSSESVTLKVALGTAKKVCAIVNPQYDYTRSVANYHDLTLITDTRLSSGPVSPYGMSGTKVTDIDAGTETVTVPVDRVASKIMLGYVVNNMDHPMTLRRVYISNVLVDGYYFNDSEVPGIWFNKRGRDVVTFPWLCESLSGTLAKGETMQVNKAFYCCNNPVLTDSTSPEWCPRHTRLVLEAEVMGSVCWYPVSVNANSPTGRIDRNSYYSITTLTVTRPGSSDPEIIADPLAVTVQATVAPWTEKDRTHSFE